MQLAKSLQAIKPSYIREILSVANSADVISLAGGLPDGDHFPLALMEQSILQLSSRAELFQYGNTAGYAPLLAYFHECYQLSDAQDALVCTGSQQGLDLIARAFLDAGDKVVMEAPSYLGALQVFGLAQASIESIQQREDGPDLQELEQCFANKTIKMFYAVPDFHNPTGVCWSLDVRKKVAQLCQQYNVALIEDAPYRELRFSGTELPLVSSFCPEHAIVLRSYSKIATPGIRLGLASGPKAWISALERVKQGADLHSSQPMQAVLLDLLQHADFPKHLDGLRQLYRQRYQYLADLLTAQLPANCQFESVEGGMFIWLSLPVGCHVDRLAKDMLEVGVAVVPSSVFYQSAEGTKPAFRLNFTNACDSDLALAVSRLVQVLASVK
ncbi:PLP-dependent aminotransferase family protein [Moritella marina ATCC 15381]|uniref:PLP-dependent aminotransferase family protein n=1 Tax=Moritella marina ATCC 15381 TaxID=1202962 RepID=A0A5J6WMS9_MORMI|nr:PLP-dependent aminotransferase family protein [Moritella marina]QFI38400.1 PLP-dependent aminotransferase family protein [Moritella marina ATCC 15381]